MKEDKYPVITKEAAIETVVFKDATVSESVDTEQSLVGWGSRPTIDRDKELIESSAWKLDNYRKNPVLLLCHKYDTPPVGKCLWVKADQNGLKFKAQFAKTERGKECYQLYKDGIMNAFSVGFKTRPGGAIDNPTEAKYKGCKRVFTDVELMEISCVPVPANSDALVEYVKSHKIQTKQLQEELEFALDIIEKNDDTQEIIVKVDDVTTDKKDTPQEVEDTQVVKKDDGVDTAKQTNDAEIEKEKTVVMVFMEYLAKSIQSLFPGKEIPLTNGEEMIAAFTGFVDDLKETVSAMEKQIEEMEIKGIKTISEEGMPSLYDISSAVDRALNPIGYGKEGSDINSKYVVDIYTTEYPSGHVVYGIYEEKKQMYYRVDYDYDIVARTAVIVGDVSAVLVSWVQDRYALNNKSGEDGIEKTEHVFSGKELSECLAKLDEAKSMIISLLAKAVVSKDDAGDFIDIDIDLGTKTSVEEDPIEIEDTVVLKDDLIEIDDDTIKSAVTEALSKNAIKIDAVSMAAEIMAKLKGKATL